MAEPADGARSLNVDADRPLIGLPFDNGGRQTVCYFIDEGDADPATPPRAVADALSLAGAWSDLDWDEAEADLDRIRHESRPTPPIEDL